MTEPRESVIRDHLAQRLELVERGLRLVEVEYPLPNAAGTRGRVDILARDIHDSWVVIELKRSGKTARDAIHEVAKYTELLRREKGLRADRIRSIVVATTWSELLVPVSHFARDSSHDVRGYELTVGPDGVPTGTRPVELLAAPRTPRTTPVHFIFHFFTEADRETGWQQIVDRAAEVGAGDLLAADFRRRDGIGSPRYGLYFAVGRMGPDDAPEALKDAAAESEGPPGYPLECEALCHILKHVFGVGFDSAGPGTLRQIQEDGNWEVEGYRSAGAFGKLTASSRRDLFRELNGDDGYAEVHYFGTARTTDRGRWPVFLTEYENSLASNEVWRVLVRSWLEDVHASGEAEVALDVFNPCDLVTAIVHGWPDHTWPLLPKLAAFAEAEVGPQRMAMGALYWDGRAVSDIAGLVRLLYPEPTSWLTARTYGDHVRRDLELVESLGLHYVLVEQINGETRVWLAREDGSPRVVSTVGELRAEGWVKGVVLGMDSFFAEHRGQLHALATEYRYALGISPSLPESSVPDTALAEPEDDRSAGVRHTEPRPVAPPAEPDLDGCSVSPSMRVPDTVLGEALVTIADLGKSDFERSVAWQVCAIRGTAEVIAADELFDTLKALHAGTDVRPGRAAAVDPTRATRSDYVLGTCYVVGTEGLRDELRRRAAVSLVMLCGESGYREARRLLDEHAWSWLPEVVERDSWATVLATYVVDDRSVPGEVRDALSALLGL